MTKIFQFNRFRIYQQFYVIPRYSSSVSLNSQTNNKNYNQKIVKSMSEATSSKSGIDSHEKWYTRGEKCQNVPEGVFKGILDRFNGITIDSSVESKKFNDFSDKLSKSLAHWLSEKRRGIWFRVYKDESGWVPILIQNGFSYHHAKRDFVMLCRWLPENEIEGFPPYAHTMMGVGGIVVNDKKQILVVSEKNGLIPDSWKLPGGYIEPGENFGDAAMREILEETNIKTKFDSLISIRHAHGAGFGCSDLYLVISLTPESSEITKCDREIAKSEWMDIDVFLNHPNVHETNRNFLRTYLKYKEMGLEIGCADEIHQMLKKKYQIFSISNL